MIAFPCSVWSQLMSLSLRTPLQRLRDQDRFLVDFAVDLALEQLRGGRHFVIENPLGSAAWTLVKSLRQLMSRSDVRQAVFHQCQFGLKASGGRPHRKATRILTSMPEVAERLDGVRCPGDHEHAPVTGGSKVTRPAGHYPTGLCRAILAGAERCWERELREERDEAEAMVGEGGNEDDDGPVPAEQEEADSEDEDIPQTHGPIRREVMKAVRKLHGNTGHRPRRELVRALAIAGAPGETILAARLLRCPDCQAMAKPHPRRVSTLPRAGGFGDVVHMDLFAVRDNLKQLFWILSVVDAASGFQVIARLENKTTEAVCQGLERSWLSWGGAPVTLVSDMWPEFASDAFASWCELHTTRLHHMPVEARWQNGIAERAGGAVKVILLKIIRQHAISGGRDIDMAFSIVSEARNDDIDSSGFAPSQWVTGRRPRRLPQVLDDAGRHLAAHGQAETTAFSRRLAIMETAKTSIVRIRFSRRLRRAALAKARTLPPSLNLAVGDLVNFYREQARRPQAGQRRTKLVLNSWHGPGILLAKEGLSGMYVGYKRHVTKCAPEAIRPAYHFEQLAAEDWSAALEDLLSEATSALPEQEEIGGQPDVGAQRLPGAPTPAPAEGTDADPGTATGPAEPVATAQPTDEPTELAKLRDST